VKLLLPQFLERVEQMIEGVGDRSIPRCDGSSAVADAIVPTNNISASGPEQVILRYSVVTS
jgi:hypothetical protein